MGDVTVGLQSRSESSSFLVPQCSFPTDFDLHVWPSQQLKKHHNTAQALNYRLGIFESMQPVGTFCQWRGKPFLKHPGPHQPTILRHLFRNNYKPSTPAAPRYAFTPSTRSTIPSSVRRKAQKKKPTENENKCWFNPFWFYSRMELLMQLCINLTLRHTNTHWVVRHECRNTHTHSTVAFFFFLNIPYSAIGWKIESVSNSKVRCVLI